MWNYRKDQYDRWVRGVALLLAFDWCFSSLHSSVVAGQSWIPDDFPILNWAPTVAPPGARYTGNQSCASCHVNQAKSYFSTPMAHALEFPEVSTILRNQPRLSFRNGSLIYEIVKNRNGSTLTVADGSRSISAPIRWSVGYGVGSVGQTFILEYGGLFYESRVSFYAETRALDITMGHVQKPPMLLEEALGNWLDDTALTACLRCHATAATTGSGLRVDQMIPGIGCEGCHGPGANHIEAVRAGDSKDLHIFNPGHLRPGRVTDFCGTCHRTTAHQKILNVRGVENARFQGYRLERSRCYDRADLRISCVTCHNPHQSIERNVSFYDAKCLACHGAQSATAHRCRVGKQECVPCHMPKVQMPAAHTSFTDHWIRVVRPGEPYPA